MSPAEVPAALRAAQLAEICAETAEWIASDLESREAGGAGFHAAAVRRIRRRAACYHAAADRLRAG